MYRIILKSLNGSENVIGEIRDANGLKNLVLELSKQYLGTYHLINNGVLKSIGNDGRTIEIKYIG